VIADLAIGKLLVKVDLTDARHMSWRGVAIRTMPVIEIRRSGRQGMPDTTHPRLAIWETVD
jgi:hypothetical protein